MSNSTDVFLRAMVSQAPVYIVAIDGEGRFVRLEGDLVRRMGIDPERAIGASAFDYLQVCRS
ncbi:MAG: hypothetical protein FJ037_00620 [Chloroflexi bacterium]|nr:hypothetical protein [Chloroflexota bacterium]